jgi:hypothetical protein
LFFTVKQLQEITHYNTFTADFHFFLPGLLSFAFADGAIYQPAESTGIIFISWAFLAAFRGAFFYDPAGLGQVTVSSFPR